MTWGQINIIALLCLSAICLFVSLHNLFRYIIGGKSYARMAIDMKEKNKRDLEDFPCPSMMNSLSTTVAVITTAIIYCFYIFSCMKFGFINEYFASIIIPIYSINFYLLAVILHNQKIITVSDVPYGYGFFSFLSSISGIFLPGYVIYKIFSSGMISTMWNI